MPEAATTVARPVDLETVKLTAGAHNSFEPVKLSLQESALDLLGRLIECK